MLCPATDNHTSCEIHSVNPILHAKSMSAAEILHELRVVYSQNVTSEGTVGQWCRMFKNGQTNIHDEERSGRPAIRSER
jgi:hypothetical protein